MTYFWCSQHEQAHLKGEDVADCLLVGPFSTKREAEEWVGSSSSEEQCAGPFVDARDCPVHRKDTLRSEKEELESDAYQAIQILGAAITGEDHGCHVGNLAEMAQEVASRLRAAQSATGALALLREWYDEYAGSTLPGGKRVNADLDARTGALLGLASTAKKEGKDA